jgi:hypothetical protein
MITISSRVLAERWLEQNGYIPDITYGAFWGHSAQTLGVLYGPCRDTLRRFIGRHVLGIESDQRAVLGVLVFVSDSAWRLDVEGEENIQRAERLCAQMSKELGKKIDPVLVSRQEHVISYIGT